MLRKSTFRASSDIALIKYWGKKDEALRLPENGSISFILAGLDTTTTVEFSERYTQDQVVIEGNTLTREAKRVREHLDRLRARADVSLRARVESTNTFPRGTGLSSSGSGFAALTYAAAAALDLHLSEREMSILARLASGTACRCVCGGFVEWRDGDTSDTSYAETIFPAEHWDLCDVVAVVDEGMKEVSSTEGHQAAQTSPFYPARMAHIGQKISAMRDAIARRDFTALGEIAEAETLEFHSILLTSQPPLVAWRPGTIDVINAVHGMRRAGIEAYFTINTGFNVHILTTPAHEDAVTVRLSALPAVNKVIGARIGPKPIALDTHLF